MTEPTYEEEERASLAREWSRDARNGAGDPWQEIYDQGYAPVLEHIADIFDRYNERLARKPASG